MVATLAGLGALVLGLCLLLLPLLATELSRPGDSAWGALVLVLALVLVTCADRLTGSPMLAVISGGLVMGRLTVEVGHGRWRQLSQEEQGRLGSWERWRTSLSQSRATLLSLVQTWGDKASGLLAWWRERRQPKTIGKRWVRQEDTPPAATEAPGLDSPEVVEVKDFAEIDVLLQAAPEPPDQPQHPPAQDPGDPAPGKEATGEAG